MKIKWKVSPAHTGRYRSFETRSWPTADYPNEITAAAIYCENKYAPWRVKENNHKELTLMIADHSTTPWHYVKAKQKFKTLQEAKNGLLIILKAHPHLIPKEVKE